MSVRPASVLTESLANRTIPPVLGPLPPVPTRFSPDLCRVGQASLPLSPRCRTWRSELRPGGHHRGARLLMVAGRGPRPVNPRPGGVARSPLRCARALQPLSHPHSLRSRESGFRPPGLFGVDSPPNQPDREASAPPTERANHERLHHHRRSSVRTTDRHQRRAGPPSRTRRRRDGRRINPDRGEIPPWIGRRPCPTTWLGQSRPRPG